MLQGLKVPSKEVDVYMNAMINRYETMFSVVQFTMVEGLINDKLTDFGK